MDPEGRWEVGKTEAQELDQKIWLRICRMVDGNTGPTIQPKNWPENGQVVGSAERQAK